MKKIVYRPTDNVKRIFQCAGTSKFRLLRGPVRSGKSRTANDIAISELIQLPPCSVIISGHSINTAARNVMTEWREMIDPANHGLFKQNRDSKDDFITINWRGLRGKKFYVRGGGKESDFKSIQGGTFGYWYADELTRHHESFVDMAVTRLSPPFSKALFTTNADSPNHYVKKRFLDNPDLFSSGLWQQFQFSLQDNPSLTKEYISMLESMYTGVFYRRFILDEWCLAEGIIYDMFGDQCIIDAIPETKHHVVGVDYGTSNPTVFLLFGVNPTAPAGSLRIWLEREYYYDGASKQKQKTDSEYADDFVQFLGGIQPMKVYYDPSAASFHAELRRRGIFGLTAADHAVADGIRTQARMLQTGEYKIYRGCRQSIRDYDAYCWDKVAQLRGEDKPVKKDDHTKDAERYVLHSRYGGSNMDFSRITKW